MIIFAVRGQGMKLVIDEKFIAKKWKFQNFEQILFYVSQKKALEIWKLAGI